MQEKGSGCSIAVIVVIAAIVVGVIFFKEFIKWILIIGAVLVLAFAIILFILNQKEKKKKQEIVAEGMTAGDVQNIIKDSNSKLQEIRRNYYKLKDTDMQKELDAISAQFRQIFKIVNEDPKDIKSARRYINATFSSLETIVRQSVKLFEAPNLSDEAKLSLQNAKEGMVLIREATDKQINKFYENNILDLDVELAVLKKSLSSKGLLAESSAQNNENDSRKEQQ